MADLTQKVDFKKNEKVFCYHCQELYEARCMKIESKNGVVKFLVHYSGWSRTWDEWITGDKMLKDTIENRKLYQKLKATKQTKNQSLRVKSKTTQPQILPFPFKNRNKLTKKINKNLDIGENLYDVLVKDCVHVNFRKCIIKLPQNNLPTVQDLFDDYLISRFRGEDSDDSPIMKLFKKRKLKQMDFKEDPFNYNLVGNAEDLGINCRKGFYIELICGIKWLFNTKIRRMVYQNEEPQLLRLLDGKFSEEEYSKIYSPNNIDENSIIKYSSIKDSSEKEMALNNIRKVMCQYNNCFDKTDSFDAAKIFLPIYLIRMFIDDTLFHLFEFFEYKSGYEAIKLLKLLFQDFIDFMDENLNTYFTHIKINDYYNLKANMSYFKQLPDYDDHYDKIILRCKHCLSDNDDYDEPADVPMVSPDEQPENNTIKQNEHEKEIEKEE